MPITKIPIVHKFGIISHSQRLELQERLLKQSYLQSVESQKVLQTSRNPLEVTEEFVYQYNNAKTLDEREKYEATAHKMLERSKRRSGLRLNGLGQYVNLPMAWTELAQLAQCKGKIQEECLDVLITTLDQSPLERFHIPALFFLAETMLYWLRTDAVHQPYLRTGEIKLLKVTCHGILPLVV
ncbi:Transmembrane protein 232 [Mytilus edulis]|uniref:Transmembrane protein 232 n=1 Tax=Mytilus edulis TaxID=6550 RepID=A0A8S3RLS8_MYTED|nr:Transmembrane protein 232 [Mytilus edulis]